MQVRDLISFSRGYFLTCLSLYRSYLGENALASLKYFIAILRGLNTLIHPPITILDQADFRPSWTQALGKYDHVYYVRGSPLVYADLQRAGAMSSDAVVILAKESSFGQFSNTHSSSDLDQMMVDAEAIVTTVLVELKLKLSEVFTITEITNESNSIYLGNSHEHQDGQDELLTLKSTSSMWNVALRTSALEHDSTADASSIYRLPRYMAGRILHPNLSENILVQSFFNPNIHRIIRQLVGGPQSTGCILMYRESQRVRAKVTTFGDIFHYFINSKIAGITLGVYRKPTEDLVGLPIVLTAPASNYVVGFLNLDGLTLGLSYLTHHH